MIGVNIGAIILSFLPLLAMLVLTIYIIILFSRLVTAVEKIADKITKDSDRDTN